VAINSSSGVVSVAQYASLKHPNAADPDDSVSITDGALLAVVTVTDGDGDTATSSTGIGDALQFQDDGPTLGPISDSLLNWVAGNTVTKSLNGVVGADDPATFTITSFPATLTVGDGTPAQLTLLGVLSDNGTVVTYFKDADNSGTRNAGDTDFFRLTLSGGNYTFDVLQDPPPAEQNFSFAGAPSGSNLFMIFGDPSSSQIVVTGRNPLNQSQGGNITTKDVLNISQAGSTTSFGVNGQQINPVSPVDGGHEGAIITFVSGTNTNFLVPNLDQNEADVEANIDFQNVFDVTSASFTVNQTNPGIGPVTVKISAFSTAAETGVNFVDGLTNDTPVSITSASVVDFVKTSGNSQFFPAVTVNGDGTLTVTGLSTGDKVTWTTSGTHNRVLIENISNDDGVSGNDNNTFDIGGFSLVQSLPAPDEKLDFTVQIADADGDTANDNTAPFSIGLDGNHDGVFSGFAPQLASSIGSGAGTAVLTDQLLRSVVAQAIDHWRAAGVDAQSLRAMEQAPIHIADIRPGWLGMYSVSGGEIWIDVDAAGWGWSTGSTPAPGRMDLLTVVTHEYGHILGLAPTATGVMQVNLVPGVQALPEALVSTSTVAPVAALASQRVAPGLTPPVGASQVSKLEPSLARATTTVDVTPGNGVREVVLPTFARVTTNGTGIPVRGPDSAMPTGAAAFDLLPAPNLASIPTPGAQASSFADNTAAPWILSEGASEAMSADRLSLQRATDAYFAGDSWMTDLTNRSFDMKAAAALALAFAGFHAGGIERREKRNLSPVLGEEA
jgi:hypothetical protein